MRKPEVPQQTSRQKGYCARLCAVGLLMLALWGMGDHVWAQAPPDSLTTPPDSTTADSLLQAQADSLRLEQLRAQSDLEDVVTFQASDSLVLDTRLRLMVLYEDAELDYQQQEIKAARVVVDWSAETVAADGVPDTSEAGLRGAPLFTDQGQEYQTESMVFNYRTKKGRVKYARTEQGENILYATQSKRQPDQSFHVYDGIFTTCNHDPPHYYIRSKKVKVIPGKQFISGPLYMVIADVPIPAVLPFAFFPQRKGRQSGVLFPTFGEDQNRGFNLRGLGYYFAPSDFFDVTLRADIYLRGSYQVEVGTSYKKNYRYTGSLQFIQGVNRYGQEDDPDFRRESNFSLAWSHSQTITPTASLRASVNASSRNYLRQNSVQASQLFQNDLGSSIAYSKSFPGPAQWNLNVNADHRQSLTTGQISLTLPSLTLSRSRIFPFKRAEAVGPQRWYEQIGISNQSQLVSTVQVQDRNLFTPSVLDSFRVGLRHALGLSTNFKLFRYLVLTPSISGNIYAQPYREEPFWFDGLVTQLQQERNDFGIVTAESDTSIRVSEVSFRRGGGYNLAADFSTAVSLTTKVYGVLTTRSKREWTFRHTVTPSLSLSARPDFARPEWGYFRQIQTSREGRVGTVSRFANNPLGGPGGGRSLVASFSLQNLFEARHLVRNDSGKDLSTLSKQERYRYINLLDNLGLSTNYNFLADSQRLAPIRVDARTNLFGNKVSLFATGTLNPYTVVTTTLNGVEREVTTGRYLLAEGQGLARLTNANVGLNFNLAPKEKTKKKETTDSEQAFQEEGPAVPEELQARTPEEQALWELEQYSRLYLDFDVPWTLSANYNLSYNRPGNAPGTITQTFNASGTVQFTKRWNASMNSGYDFEQRRVTFTSFSLSRNLHCWTFSLTGVPFGLYTSYFFTIQVQASVLQDLKLTKRRAFQDNLVTPPPF